MNKLGDFLKDHLPFAAESSNDIKPAVVLQWRLNSCHLNQFFLHAEPNINQQIIIHE